MNKRMIRDLIIGAIKLFAPDVKNNTIEEKNPINWKARVIRVKFPKKIDIGSENITPKIGTRIPTCGFMKISKAAITRLNAKNVKELKSLTIYSGINNTA